MIGHIPAPIHCREHIAALPPALLALHRPPALLAAEWPVPEGSRWIRGEYGGTEIGGIGRGKRGKVFHVLDTGLVTGECGFY
jgi:hypothetical protein